MEHKLLVSRPVLLPCVVLVERSSLDKREDVCSEEDSALQPSTSTNIPSAYACTMYMQ